MKKILAIILAAIMALSLVACGETNTGSTGKTDGTENAQSSQSITPSEEKTPATDRKEEETESHEFKTKATIEPTVLVDQDGIKITAQELTYVGNSPQLSMLLENNTEKTLGFVSGSLGYDINSVNGYMFPSIYVNTEVTPGNKANETLKFDYEELLLYGIDEIAEIQIGFDISDDEYNDILKTGALQIKTSAFDSYDFSEDTFRRAMSDETLLSNYGISFDYSSEDVIYEDGGVKVDTVMIGTNRSDDRVALIEGYNSGSSTVYMCIADIEINGIVVSDGTWTRVAVNAGKHAVMDVNLNDVIEHGEAEFDPNAINELKFKLTLTDENVNVVASEKEIALTLGDGKTTMDIKGKEAYNQDGIKFTYTGMNTDENNYTHFVFYVENTSGKGINIDLGGLSLNGFMIDALSFTDVEDGKTGLLDVELSEYDFEDAGLKPEDVAEAEFTFEIKDANYNTIANPVIKVEVE